MKPQNKVQGHSARLAEHTPMLNARVLMHNLGITLDQAAFIVRAVNAHEEMLNALKQIKSRLTHIDELTHQEGFIVAISQQAISRAEGKESK